MTDGSSSSFRCKERGYLRNISRTLAARGSKGLSCCLPVVSFHAQRSSRTEADHQLEYETLRCIKQILNSPVCLEEYHRTLLNIHSLQLATQDALTHNLLVTQIASSLNSPRLASRKLVVEVLTFLAYRAPEILSLVTGALEAVSITNNVGTTPYAFWFASFESSISGRGKMGSLVGASEEVRKNAATESNINEYAVCVFWPRQCLSPPHQLYS